MRSTRLALLFVVVASSAAVACGGGGDEPPAPDAPAALIGLGQPCDQAMPTCPATAPLCIVNTMGKGFCSRQCVMDSMFTTDAQNMPGPLDPNPATQDAMCPPIYTGTIGTAVCGMPFNRMPTGPLQPNTTYTVQWGCAIRCGANNACPAGLVCEPAVLTCFPQ